MTYINEKLFYYFNAIVGESPTIDFIVFFIADYLDVVILVGALLFFLVHKDYKEERRFVSYQQMRTRIKEVFLITLSVGSAWGIVVFLKYLFSLPRPYLYLENVHLLFTYGNMDSFPSGHAALFAALAVAVYFHHKKLGILFAVFALFIGIARITAGVHLPFDILAGFLLGGLLSWGIYKIYARIFRFIRSK